ncbi:MAG: hypothetical protein IJ737_04675 [Ruminococcus sp.]|nr:hypothetical protein [Ruminococcus sp.]
MDIYTAALFGHRQLTDSFAVEERLMKIIRDLINSKEYVEFLVGRDGEFDLLASAVIRRAVRSFGFGNTRFILVLPYIRAEYRDNERKYLDYYDEVEICPEAAGAHPKSAIQIRNRNMVDRSDLVICCIQHKNGGAFRTVEYAKRQGKKVVNVAEQGEE